MPLSEQPELPLFGAEPPLPPAPAPPASEPPAAPPVAPEAVASATVASPGPPSPPPTTHFRHSYIMIGGEAEASGFQCSLSGREQVDLLQLPRLVPPSLAPP